MRHTRSQTRQRRSHHALVASTLSVCSNCKAFHLPHHMCLSCGFYNGRQVMDLGAEKIRRDQRLKAKRDRISVEGSVAAQPTVNAPHGADDEVQPKDEIKSAKGAAAKRLKDESLSESSTGTE